MTTHPTSAGQVTGEFVTLGGERFYAIRNVDKMPPFFISVVSSDDHWLFVSSTGGLTAGRVAPEFALFPYVTDDKIHDSTTHTGCKTVVRIQTEEGLRYWEPFNREQDALFRTTRNLYKNALGNKLCFEEINHDLNLAFRYTWSTSDIFGFVRQAELENLGDRHADVDLIDGLLNLLPAGTPAAVQAASSNLVNAYKWTELDAATGLACLTLYSGITDRAEPCESLRATTIFALGLQDHRVLISADQLDDFSAGKTPEQEEQKRGIRGAYLVSTSLSLAPESSQRWHLVANLEQSQGEVVALLHQLQQPADVFAAVTRSIDKGSDKLGGIIARADGLQLTAEESESVHHFANVLFNVMRGGNFHDQYNVLARDIAATVKHFNKQVYVANRELLEALPEKLSLDELLEKIAANGDLQLERIGREYLPLTFGRRHGDPSRPWNHFAIKLKDDKGNELLSYQGNWRDIFQNWEALTFSYPEFIESVIAKFVNASTVDGYNPYRIGKAGIDWEIEEPEDPWSYIGYWGDHQIIYLEKLLELSRGFNPEGLSALLRKPIFSYANVPYRIKPFAGLLENPKSTVLFDAALDREIEHRVAQMGADGRLVLDAEGRVYQTNLLEKLLVPLLAKLANLVVDGGIWLNTQRPEWNDANNALVGYGISMVTLCYMRRYVGFLETVLARESDAFDISAEVSAWFADTAAALEDIRGMLAEGPLDNRQRGKALAELGEAASHYREKVYRQGGFSALSTQPAENILAMLGAAREIIDRSMAANLRDDGLYHAYNLIDIRDGEIGVDHLYPMLEGQVAALSAGTIAPPDVVKVVEALFNSEMYRPDQRSFTLYPDRKLPGFLAKNRFDVERAKKIPLLAKLLAAGNESIVYQDADGWCRFNADLINVDTLRAALAERGDDFAAEVQAGRAAVEALYEDVFQHRAFTGRSGTMFGYEGLGSIYWHMVSKLLLAIQENYFAALKQGADDAIATRLGELYYQVREGLGFNKTPLEYGAFPTDPYSHTPRHVGASQPGMTGQVKEEVLSRFGELGVRVSDGAVSFQPSLLRQREFLNDVREFRYLDIAGNWQTETVPVSALAFTWCQVPIIYQLSDAAGVTTTVGWDDGQDQVLTGRDLPHEIATELFRRSGRIRRLTLSLGAKQLFGL